MAVQPRRSCLSKNLTTGVRVRVMSSLFLCVALCNAFAASATPNDIRVLTDEISALGTKTIEFQGSLAKPLKNSPLGAGLAFQGLAEFAYGFAEHWEISAQFPVKRLDGAWNASGINAELQFVAPHDDDDGFYWGARAEIGYALPAGDRRTWQVEMRPVLGYRAANWHFVLNTAVTKALTGDDKKIKFEPSAKVLYQLTKRNSVGTEYFVEAGPLSNVLPRSQRRELAFLVVDSKIGKSDVSFGFGRGLTNASDRLVVKFIISTAFD